MIDLRIHIIDKEFYGVSAVLQKLNNKIVWNVSSYFWDDFPVLEVKQLPKFSFESTLGKLDNDSRAVAYFYTGVAYRQCFNSHLKRLKYDYYKDDPPCIIPMFTFGAFSGDNHDWARRGRSLTRQPRFIISGDK